MSLPRSSRDSSSVGDEHAPMSRFPHGPVHATHLWAPYHGKRSRGGHPRESPSRCRTCVAATWDERPAGVLGPASILTHDSRNAFPIPMRCVRGSFQASPYFSGSPRSRGRSIRFLFVGAAIRVRLPSDPAQRRARLASAIPFCATSARSSLSLKMQGMPLAHKEKGRRPVAAPPSETSFQPYHRYMPGNTSPSFGSTAPITSTPAPRATSIA